MHEVENYAVGSAVGASTQQGCKTGLTRGISTVHCGPEDGFWHASSHRVLADSEMDLQSSSMSVDQT